MAAFGGHATPARVTDLRGRVSPGPISPVLVDPTGRRARQLRVVGRVLASVLLLWLCGLALGGIGLLPLPNVPGGDGLRVAQEPAAIRSAPHDPGASALGSALPAMGPSGLLRAVRTGAAHLTPQAGHGRGTSATSQATGAVQPERHHGSGRGSGGGVAGHPSGHGSTSVTSSSTSSSTSTSSTSTTANSHASPHGAVQGRSSQAHAGTTSNSHGSVQGTSSSSSTHGNGQHRALGHGVTGG